MPIDSNGAEMPRRLRVGIVGLGFIVAAEPAAASAPVLGTGAPASHAAALACFPELEVVAVCDTNPGALEAFAAKWRPTWPAIQIYGDHQKMLSSAALDMVVVATPDDQHAPILVDVINAGVKLVMSEKPLATSVEEADQVIAAADRCGTTIAVNFTRRWDPNFVEARRIVQAGEIGPLRHITIHCGGPRAMLYRIHSHMFDLMCFCADSSPEWVSAELEAGQEDYGIAYKGDGGNDPALEPGLNCYVAFENGVRGYLSGTKGVASEVQLVLSGESGRVSCDAEGLRLVRSPQKKSKNHAATASRPSIEPVKPKFTRSGLVACIAELLKAAEEKRSPWSSEHTSRQAVTIIDAALRSQSANGARTRVR